MTYMVMASVVGAYSYGLYSYGPSSRCLHRYGQYEYVVYIYKDRGQNITSRDKYAVMVNRVMTSVVILRAKP